MRRASPLREHGPRHAADLRRGVPGRGHRARGFPAAHQQELGPENSPRRLMPRPAISSEVARSSTRIASRARSASTLGQGRRRTGTRAERRRGSEGGDGDDLHQELGVASRPRRWRGRACRRHHPCVPRAFISSKPRMSARSCGGEQLPLVGARAFSRSSIFFSTCSVAPSPPRTSPRRLPARYTVSP